MCLIMKLLINTKQVRQEKQTSDTLTLLNDTDTVGVCVCVCDTKITTQSSSVCFYIFIHYHTKCSRFKIHLVALFLQLSHLELTK